MQTHTQWTATGNTEKQPDAGLVCADMKWKSWPLALILALLKTKWTFFLGGIEGDGTWEAQGFDSTPVSITHSPMRVLENSFSRYVPRSPFPLATSGDMEDTPPITVWFLTFW